MTARLPGPGASWQTTRWRRILSATMPVAVGVLVAYAWTAAGGHVPSHRHVAAAVAGAQGVDSPPTADGNGASREPFATHRLHDASPAATQWVQPAVPRETYVPRWPRHAHLQHRFGYSRGHRLPSKLGLPPRHKTQPRHRQPSRHNQPPRRKQHPKHGNRPGQPPAKPRNQARKPLNQARTVRKHPTISGRSGVPPAPGPIRSTRLHIGT